MIRVEKANPSGRGVTPRPVVRPGSQDQPHPGIPVDGVVAPILRNTRTDSGDVDPVALRDMWSVLPEVAHSQLLEVAAAAIGMPANTIALRQISGQGAKGVSGTPVDVIETVGPDPKPVGILKIAFDEGFAREVGSMLYLSEDLPQEVHPDSTSPHVLELARTQFNGRTAGVMVMELAAGQPMDDLLTAVVQAGPQDKAAAEAKLLRAVAAGADALTEWHIRTPGSGTQAPIGYIKRYQDKLNDVLQDLEIRYQGPVQAMGLSFVALRQAADDAIHGVHRNPGVNGLTHGDAHIGNFTYDDEGTPKVTLLDFNRLHQSIDHNGAPTGAPARDVVRYWYGLRWFGELFGMSPDVISRCETVALERFKTQDAPQTPEAIQFFRLHAALDLLHFSLSHESPEVNARMEAFHRRNIVAAMEGGPI